MEREKNRGKAFVRNIAGCLLLFLCIFTGLLFGACASPGAQSSQDNQEDRKEPILDADATDEELMELIEDDINYVEAESYGKVVAEIREDTKKFSGQLYQFKGFFTKDNGTPYISDSPADNGEAGNRLPLRYLTEEPGEGTEVRITGVVNEDEVEGVKTPVLDVVTVETDAS